MFMRVPGEYVTKSMDLGVRTAPPYDGHYNRSSGCALSAEFRGRVVNSLECGFGSRGRPFVPWSTWSGGHSPLAGRGRTDRPVPASPTIRKSLDRRRRPGSVSGFCTWNPNYAVPEILPPSLPEWVVFGLFLGSIESTARWSYGKCASGPKIPKTRPWRHCRFSWLSFKQWEIIYEFQDFDI